MNHKDLISQFKKTYNLTSDAEAAHVLDIQKTALSAYVNDKKPMPVGLKFRVLEHVQFSQEIKKLAAVFVDMEDHQVQMTQDLDRVEELKRRRAGMPVNFTDQKWIERVNTLQENHGLDDKQTAKYMEMNGTDLQEIKAGKKELSLGQKALLLGLLAVKNAVQKERLKRNLTKRAEKN